jgi:site-specific DNA-methyltransferase (adenine-specific)
MNDYHFKHEPCFYGWKDGAAHYFVNDRTQTTVIEEAKPQASKLHPTMKPIKLLARHIRNSSKKSEKVIDLFGGSGSTLMACEELGRKCYMMEYDPQYVDVIIKRWEDFTGRKAEKIK